MKLTRPVVIGARPGILIPIIGGMAGTLVLTAGIYLAPRLGFPFIDVLHMIGGIFVSNADAALFLGFGIHFLNGGILFPIIYGLVFLLLPGPMTGIVGDIVKGVSWGLLLWLASGLTLPLVDVLNKLPSDIAPPAGFFGLQFGWKGALAMFGGHVVYGLALGLTSYMAADIFPLETLGWNGYRKAELPPAGKLYEDPDLPEYPFIGNR